MTCPERDIELDELTGYHWMRKAGDSNPSAATLYGSNSESGTHSGSAFQTGWPGTPRAIFLVTPRPGSFRVAAGGMVVSSSVREEV